MFALRVRKAPSLREHFTVLRYLSTKIDELLGRRVAIENNFKYGGFFQDSFRRSRLAAINKARTLEDQENQHDQTRVSKSVDISYRGEILFGIHPVYLALQQQKRQFFQLFLKEQFNSRSDFSKREMKMQIELLAQKIGVNVKKMSTRNFNLLVPQEVHQGVCLDASVIPLHECEEKDFELCNTDDMREPFPLWLVLDAIQDPMNFGAILRSSYFFGVDRIITVRNNSCRLSPVVSKASSGAMEVMDIFCISDLINFIQQVKSSGWCVVSTAVCDEASVSTCKVCELHHFSMEKPTVVILGNEAKGVSPEIQQLCDVIISIHPRGNLFPGIDSLNVSVATGIMLHHMKKSSSTK